MTTRIALRPAAVAVTLCVLIAGLAAQADPAAEVLAVRTRIAQAVKQQDRATLDRLFTADFTHTHAVGRRDDKARRLQSLVSGEATIDSVTPDQIQIRFYGSDRSTAIAVGQSTVGTDRYGWTVVYIKGATGWQAAASHASPVQ